MSGQWRRQGYAVCFLSRGHGNGIEMARLNDLNESCRSLFARIDGDRLFYVLVIILAMYSIGQLTSPFIAHDDYDWLNSGFDQGFESPWSKSFSEGRWGNFLWSKVSYHLNGYSAFGIYLILYSLMCIGMARLAVPAAGSIGALLLFFSPMAAETTQWPVTQMTGVAVSALAFAGMSKVKGDRGRMAAMAVGVVIGYLFYPSFGPLFLLLYGAAFTGCWRQGIGGAMVYVGSFVGAVLLVFSLNYIFHDHFTIQPASWRQATPLFANGTLDGNIDRYLSYFAAVKSLWVALVAATAAFVLCIYFERRRRQCIIVLSYGCLLLGMDATLSIVSGLAIPLRSSLWLWVLICIPITFLIYDRRMWMAWVGLALAIPVLWVGLASWNSTYANSRTVYPAMNALGQQVSRVAAQNEGRFDSVIMFGDAHANAALRPLHSNRALRNYLYKEFKLYTSPCDPALCARIETELAKRTEVPEWLLMEHKLVWVLSPKSGDLY